MLIYLYGQFRPSLLEFFVFAEVRFWDEDLEHLSCLWADVVFVQQYRESHYSLMSKRDPIAQSRLFVLLYTQYYGAVYGLV